MYYKRYKINFKRLRSYISSPDWKKRKTTTINPIKDDNNCFQYTARTILCQEEIGKSPKKIPNYLPFINWYKWEGIKYPPGKEDCVKREKKKRNVAVIVLYVKELQICLAYISKHNMSSIHKIIFLIISNGEVYGIIL